jgi:protein-L-isoaspartate(D-aspartate) O-methyltransferase
MAYTDDFKDKGNRKKLVKLLESRGIKDPAVLAAIEKVPRHWFLDTAFYSQAYSDQAFKIGAGQTISHPSTVGFQSQLLMLEKGDKVLEIGTGSGYQTAILCELGAKVFSIERQKALFDSTKTALPEMGYPAARLFYGDGYIGLPQFAPFDKIIVTAGAPFIPPALVEQLKPGGILVIPVGTNEKHEMTSIVKSPDGSIETFKYGDFSFVPLLVERSK